MYKIFELDLFPQIIVVCGYKDCYIGKKRQTFGGTVERPIMDNGR